MTFTPTLDEEIKIDGLSEVRPEENLIYRAAQILKPHAKTLWLGHQN